MRFNFITLAFALLASLSFADDGHRQPKVQLDCSQVNVRCAKTVTPAVDELGQLWLAFVQGQALYVQTYSKGQWLEPTLVSSVNEAINNQGEDRPKLAFGPKGEMFLSWTTPQPKDYSGDIRFTRSLNKGKTFDEPRTINQDGLITSHRFSTLAVNNLGEIYLAWVDKRDHFSPENKAKKNIGAAIYFTSSKDHGKTFQQQEQALEKQSCECCRIAMSFDNHQQPLVFFRNVFERSERDHALVRVQYGQVQPPQRINFDHWQLNGCPHQGPDMLHRQGITHFAWFSHHQLGYRYQTADGKLSRAIKVGQAGSQHPSFAYLNGVLYLAYQQYGDDSMNVWLQSSKDNGQRWNNAKIIASTQGGSDYPFLVNDGKQVQLVWLTQQEGLRLEAVQP